jgi:hypothetical protein
MRQKALHSTGVKPTFRFGSFSSLKVGSGQNMRISNFATHQHNCHRNEVNISGCLCMKQHRMDAQMHHHSSYKHSGQCCADQEANSQGAPNMVKQKYNSSYGITKLHVDNFLYL